MKILLAVYLKSLYFSSINNSVVSGSFYNFIYIDLNFTYNVNTWSLGYNFIFVGLLPLLTFVKWHVGL